MRFFTLILSFIAIEFIAQFNPDLFVDRYPESGIYATEIRLLPKENEKVYFSNDGLFKEGHIQWITTEHKINKTSSYLIRIKSDEIDTVIHRSYHFDYYSKFPVLSISINPEDLWNDSTGIYVKGKNAYWSDSTGYWENCNYQQKWEKEIFATYIDTNNIVGFSQKCGLKIFGESTRRQPDKSMKLVARSEYGDKDFSYQVFPQKSLTDFKQIAIRTSGNDFNGSRFKDVLSAYLARNLGLDYMAYQPANLFVNGEYWGVYNLREKVNEHYIASNHNVDKDSVNIIMGRWVRQEGSSKDYLKMYHWFEALDTMDNAAYEKAKQFIDIRNYINYRVFQIYINNKDSRGNIRYYNVSGVQPQFRMILYDTDLGYGKYSFNFLEGCMSTNPTDWFNPTWSTMYLTKLMQHPEFRNDFVTQFAHQMNTIFQRDSMLNAINHFEELYKGELPEKASERPSHLKSVIFPMDKWMEEVNSLKSYAKLRPTVMWTHLQQVLDLEDSYCIKFMHDSVANQGMIKINDNYPLPLHFEGRYFKDIPLKIEAVASPGYKFTGWNEQHVDPVFVLVSFTDTVVLTPQFIKIEEQPASIAPEQSPNQKKEEIKSLSFEEMIRKHESLITYISFGLMAIGLLMIILFIFSKK